MLYGHILNLLSHLSLAPSIRGLLIWTPEPITTRLGSLLHEGIQFPAPLRSKGSRAANSRCRGTDPISTPLSSRNLAAESHGWNMECIFPLKKYIDAHRSSSIEDSSLKRCKACEVTCACGKDSCNAPTRPRDLYKIRLRSSLLEASDLSKPISRAASRMS